MSLHEFEAKMFKNLYDFFDERQFLLLPQLRQFRKVTNTGFDNVIFSVSPYENEFWLDVHFGNRYDAIESIAQQFLTNRLEYRTEANTLLTTIGRFRQRNYFRYKLKDSQDLITTSDDIRDFFSSKGFAFFDLARSITEIDGIINEIPHQRCPYINNSVQRCFKGLIAARLAENSRFETLYAEYKEQLRIRMKDAPILLAFDRLYTYLNYYSYN